MQIGPSFCHRKMFFSKICQLLLLCELKLIESDINNFVHLVLTLKIVYTFVDICNIAVTIRDIKKSEGF